jgi:uncharacterized protein (TIGR02265 family)
MNEPKRHGGPLVPELLIFEHVIDGLMRGIGAQRTAQLERRLMEAGWSGPKKKIPAYPLDTWRTFLRIAREELFPGQPEAPGYEKLGEMFMDGYFETALGSAIAALARLLGPGRTLTRATRQFRSANNFSETKVTELGPNRYELWMNSVDQFDFTVGIVRRTLEGTGAKDVRVIMHPGVDDDSCKFEISWS